jgi:NADPH-dependent curcumin reductase CurA
MSSPKNRDIRLIRRPAGLPEARDFELNETPVPSAAPGQVLVKNLWMSVDPYMRGRMSDRKSYAPPFQIGEILAGGAVGRVVTGNGPFAAGDYVLSMNGWREWFVSDGTGLTKVDASRAPVQAYLGVLGMPGMTAYAGLKRIGGLKPDDRVFVSAAAGAVGSVVCQIARNLGCEIVVGSAGTDEKCTWLKNEAGVTEAINYREADNLREAIADAMPGGIDLYYENVGGAHLEAALDNMREHGRIAVCGLIDQYNSAEPPPGPRNLGLVLTRKLTMRGFIVMDHYDLWDRFVEDMSGWIAAGKMKWRETVVDGIENAPAALIGLFHGDNIGKMLVKLAKDD